MDFERSDERLAMVKDQIQARGVRNPLVLQAMRDIPRHLFVPEELSPKAYTDGPLPIGFGQTISQPYIVGSMIELLEPQKEHRILEVGLGSGYLAAVLSSLVSEVLAIEREPQLLEPALVRLKTLGLANVQAKAGDGSLGWAEKSPFDSILVSAGSPGIPKSLIAQLKIGGTLLIPVGKREEQALVRVIKRSETHFQEKELYRVKFVPLVGAEGWKE
jgi:protein-L-isoaspartate(D-aspartate) O-methyltransferase